MDRFIKKTQIFIFSKQGSIFSSAIIISSMTLLSRFFGFLRYRVLAGFFTKEELDIFFASFRIPDLIFETLITGALTSAFIPIFIKYQKNKEKLDTNISSIINFIFLSMTIFVIFIFLIIDKIIPLITPGYSSERNNQIIFFSRLLLVGQLPFLILGNLLTGIAQANKVFLLSTLAPLFYNLTIISITFFFSYKFSLKAPIFGTIIGALFFFLIQIPILFRYKFSYQLILKKTHGLIEFVKIILPRTITTIASQIDSTIDLTLTTFLGAGSYTIFYFAQHLQLLPVSVIGIAFGQAALPYLSEIYQERKIEELKKIITDSILNLLFLSIPVASFFIFARTPLVRLFFGGEKFDWDATVKTATTLSYFALSLPIHNIYYFLTRCFYAFLDSKTPFIISIVAITINTFFSIYFILFLKLPVWSLALSFSLAISFNVFLLLFFLFIKLNGLNYKFLIIETLKIIIISLISSCITYNLMKILDKLIFDTTRTIYIFFLLLICSLVYFGLYLFLSSVLNIKQVYLIAKLIIKEKEYQKKIIEIYNHYE